jgi:hypothetical protein
VQLQGLGSFTLRSIAADNIPGVAQGAGEYTFPGDSVAPGDTAALHLQLVAKSAGNDVVDLIAWGQKDPNTIEITPASAPSVTCSYSITP